MTDSRQPQPSPVFQSPADRVAHAYRMWRESKGQTAALFLDMMAEDVEMRSVLDPTTENPLAQPRDGVAEARAYMEVIARDWEMIDYPTERVVSDGNTVVWIGRCHWRHRETGSEIDSPKVDIWHFKDGKAVNFLEMFDTLGFARTTGLI